MRRIAGYGPTVALVLAALVGPRAAGAFPPAELLPAEAPDDSPWSALNEIVEVRAGWDHATLTYEVDYTIETNAVVTMVAAGTPGGEDAFASWDGYGGAFPSDVDTSLGVDHMAAFWGCNDLFVYQVHDGASTDVSTDPGVNAFRSAPTCDGSGGTLHVAIDWDVLTGQPLGVPAGLTLYLAAFIRAGDDTAPADVAPDQPVAGFHDTWYEIEVDGDRDGLADGAWTPPVSGAVVPDPVDHDGDGYAAYDGDCDDTDAAVFPGAVEVCGDGVDSDCLGGLAAETDDDGDGWFECNGDCDDADDTTYPGAPLGCDGGDHDCDGVVDLDEADVDDDGDGYTVCQGDCDDTDPLVYPGATENPCDQVDTDCDGVPHPDETDDDGDGWDECQGDCDDADASLHPAAAEVACDYVDNDCDGLLHPEEVDDDGDGWDECDGDCADADSGVHPGVAEDCADGVDNDCDGLTDGADPDCGGDDDSGDDDSGDDDSGDDDTADDDSGDDDTGDDDAADDDAADDDDATDDGDDDAGADDGGCACRTVATPQIPSPLGFALLAGWLLIRRRT